MKDKEKQIEEILEKVGIRYGMDVGGISYIVNAHKLTPYLQPKLPEHSVVLSNGLLEVNDVKSVDELIIVSRPNLMAKLDLKEKEVSKETAERDFNKIIKALEERKDRVKIVYDIAEKRGIDMAIAEVERIAKQLGVDIKE